MLDFRITLEARNPARRCSRQYRVEAGTDLFGSWVVAITYGRIGTAGRSRSYVVRDEEEARHLARSILKRRASAHASGSRIASASSSIPRGGPGRWNAASGTRTPRPAEDCPADRGARVDRRTGWFKRRRPACDDSRRSPASSGVFAGRAGEVTLRGAHSRSLAKVSQTTGWGGPDERL